MKLLLDVSAEHRELVRHFKRAPFDVNELPANTARCPQFGGCPYRAETGGPCTKTRTIGEMMSQSNQQPPSDIEAMLAARRNGQAAPGAPPPMPPGMTPYGAPSQGNWQTQTPVPQAGPPPMAAPPPLAPPGPPQAQAPGFPGIPQGAPQAPAPMAAPPQYPGYQQGPDGQWYPVPQAAPVTPPGWQPAPAAPHLPPESQLLPQVMAAQPMVPAGHHALPQAPAAPVEAPKKGRGRPRATAEQAQATAAGLPGGIPGSGSDELQPLPVDARAVFLRACVLCTSSSVDLSDARLIEQQAKNALQYAELVWTYLQYTKA
jgi:hypothetical protein